MNYFHVPMWFAMMFLFTYSVWASIQYLRTQKIDYDDRAIESLNVAFLFGGLGLVTGMLWGNATWGTFWTNDPKLNNTAIGLLIYSAYFVLRGSLQDETQRGRLSAVYNIFSYIVFIPLIYVLPRMTDSLHPGNGNNPTFRLFDTAHNMKLVVYTAIIAFIALGWWFFTICLRLRLLKKSEDEIL
jgi:heme exporter protein C